MFGFDLLSGFKFYLNSGFVLEGDGFEVAEVTPSSISLVSLDGKISKTISLKEGDYELMIKDSWVGEVPADTPTPYVAMYRTDGRALDERGGQVARLHVLPGRQGRCVLPGGHFLEHEAH